MIPKIIHYCWFGEGEKSPLIKKCIASWKKYCPDYEIIEWNEDNFDIDSNRFAKEAYETKKYAFVSDYLRLYVLNKYGGIYVDTDLEIKKNIDVFLKNRAFSGFEVKDFIPTAIMGAEKGHPWIKLNLDYYKDKKFILDDGTLNVKANPRIITEITKENYSLVLNNKEQILEDGLHIYPDYVFCNNVIKSKNYSEHHFEGSWLDTIVIKENYLKYKKNYNVLISVLNHFASKKEINFPIDYYNNIYLFGVGNIAEQLVKYFAKMKYKLDQIIVRDDKNEVYGLPTINIKALDELNETDLIIVVPSYDFNAICEDFSLITEADIVSIEYLFDLRIIY